MSTNKTATRKDPLPSFCFKVSLGLAGDATADMFFKSVSGLSYETEVFPVPEGGNNATTFQLVGATKWSNIVLKQGFTASSAVLAWREGWLTGSSRVRQSGTITLLDTSLQAKVTWQFYRGWPCKWSLGELDATKSELAIETLEIAHEGLLKVG